MYIKIHGYLPSSVRRVKIIEAIRHFIRPYIPHTMYGKTILSILIRYKIKRNDFYYYIGKTELRKYEKDHILNCIIKGEGECPDCGGDFETYDFREAGEDEFSMTVTHLEQRCVICNYLKTIKL